MLSSFPQVKQFGVSSEPYVSVSPRVWKNNITTYTIISMYMN